MSRLRKSARGRECQIRIPGVCNGDPETTVLAHIGGGGMGMKSSDLHGAFSCSDCHDAVDGRRKTGWSNEELRLWHWQGVERTQNAWLLEGLIKV